MPLTKLGEISNDISDFKAQIVDAQLRQEASLVNEHVSASTGETGGADSTGGPPQDAMVEMSTIMEGFRYLKNDNTVYPVLKDGQPCEDFPIIPVGMLSIWREQDEGDDLDAMLNM